MFTILKNSFIIAMSLIELNFKREELFVMEQISTEIIQRAQQGDEDAFQKIYDQYYKHVYTYALRLSKNDADAKDIAQETFLQVYRSIQTLQKPDYFPLWLNRIVYSKFHRVISKQKETAIEQDSLAYHVDNSEKAKQWNDHHLLDDEDVIHQMIKKLSDKQREVINLVYYEQYTANEIAKLLKLPEGTVKSRIFEAKKALHKQIKEFERIENRKLELHSDVLIPAGAFALLAKCKHLFQHTSFAQKMLVVSMTSMVVVSTVAVSQTLPYLQNAEAETKEPLSKPVFHAVIYQKQTIDNAKSAYYALMKWAPDAQHIAKKSDEEKAEIRPVLEELKSINSPYYQLLLKDGWIQAFEK